MQTESRRLRLYLDESGDGSSRSTADPMQRFLCLTGIILDYQEVSIIQQRLVDLRARYFHTDPDERVTLHRHELVHRRGPFAVLMDPEVDRAFRTDLLGFVSATPFTTIAVTLDKLAYIHRMGRWRYPPYHYALAVLLEQFVVDLLQTGAKGDVLIERRGRREDRDLSRHFAHLVEHGTEGVSPRAFEHALALPKLEFRDKHQDVVGLQLADLFCHGISIEQQCITGFAQPGARGLWTVLSTICFWNRNSAGTKTGLSRIGAPSGSPDRVATRSRGKKNGPAGAARGLRPPLPASWSSPIIPPGIDTGQ